MPLYGKVAVVTGSSGGIGAAIAETLACAGAKVVLSARRVEELEKVKSDIEAKVGSDKVLICKADVTKREEVKALVAAAEKSFGPVDIMVNNAGESSVFCFMRSAGVYLLDAPVLPCVGDGRGRISCPVSLTLWS